MNLPSFLSRRIYNSEADSNRSSDEQPQNRNVSKPAIRIAIVGVAIGLAVRIITVSVILGFKHTIRDKVVGFGSHIQVENILSMNTMSEYPICIDDSMLQVLNGKHLMCSPPFCSYYWFGIYLCILFLFTDYHEMFNMHTLLNTVYINQYFYSLGQYNILRLL